MNEKLRGVIPRIVTYIFETITNSPQHIEFIVNLTMLEVYMEDIRDLLNPANSSKVKIRESPTEGIFIDNITEKCVGDELEVEATLAAGNNNRKIGRTNMNAVSSRSHAMTIVHIQQNNTKENKVVKGKMYLVDLAGSEKISKTGATGETLEEAKLINKGLLALGGVINALTEGQPFVPYRNSKLTRILQESIGGNSKTTLIIACSPAMYNEAETLSTLRFGQRAKLIKNKPKQNEELSREQLMKLLDQADGKIKYLHARISFLENYIMVDLGKPLPQFQMKDGDEESRPSEIPSGSKKNITSTEATSMREVPAQSAASSEEVMKLRDEVARLAEENANMSSTIQELGNQNASLETKFKMSKDQNALLTSKLTVILKNMQLLDNQNVILSERIHELEGNKRELLAMIDDLENNQKREPVDISNISMILNQQNESIDLKSPQDFSTYIENLSVSNNEKESILKFTGIKFQELQKATLKVQNFKKIIQDLVSNYQRIIEKELPQLEVDHKLVVEGIKRGEKRNNFIFNEKLMNVIQTYVHKNEILERTVTQQETSLKQMQEETKKTEQRYKQKVQSLRQKIDLLVRCITICIKKLEDFRTMKLQDTQVKREIKLNELDAYVSNFNTVDRGTWGGADASGNKVIKLIRGS
jgi:kinesin family protein 5